MKKNTITKLTVAGIACIMSASVSFATPIYDTFGNLPGATFGGTGNPTDPVAITTGGGITLGLAAQQRYFNAPLTSSAGTYYATTGQNAGDLAHPTTTGVSPYKYLGSTWNFDFYIGGTGIGAYTYSISYGLAGGTVYSFNPAADADASSVSGILQDSQNLLFGNFGGAANGFAGLFDPNADATYDFLLTATPVTGGQKLQSGITVVVGKGSTVPDSASTLALMGMAFAGIAGLRRKFLA